MNHGFVFCYWDDPVEWRNERQTKNNNSLSNFEKKQEVSNKDIRKHECGRSIEHNEKEADNSV